MHLDSSFLGKPLRSFALVIVGASLSVMAACASPSEDVGNAPSPIETTEDVSNAPPPIETTSGTAEITLAKHLAEIGAKKYGAYWCPHCHSQQALFGKEAFEKITYVECAQDGQDSETAACQEAGVEGFPSWEINGELYPGIRQLDELASLSNYNGPMDFSNQLSTE
ncbi:MAG: hypothetical protein AAGD25_40960 [Cyanobacteria bacterium P01_F01_bin.150]